METDEKRVDEVWKRGQTVPGVNPREFRKDECDAWISKSKYGDTDSPYGWEIDHISPGGPDVLSNLRPLQWENNRDKSDGRLKCNIKADGNKNVWRG